MPTTDPSEARAAGTGGALNVSDEGSVKVAGNAMLTVVGEVTLAPGGTYAPDSARTAATSATLEADTVLITSDNFPNGAKGVMLLEDTMRVEVGLSAARLTASGDFKLFCGGAVRDGNLRPGGDPSRGGCTPPILNASGGSQLQLGGSLIIEGDVNLRIRNVPIVATSSTASPQSGTTPGVTIGGDFDNRATDPTLFDWRSGSLAMTGVDATFKIAGQDVGDDPSGFMNNYAMGRIDVAPGASVRFIASEAGFPGDGLPAGLYVGEFVLSAGSTITIDGATVGYQVFDDQGGTVVLENGGELLPVPCATNADCDDASGCTFEQCVGSVCTTGPSRYGDLAGDGGTCGPDGDVNLSDILAVLDGFSGTFSPGCERANIDIAGDAGSCAPNGSIDLGDILAVLDAFQGLDSCCADGR